MAKNFKKKKLRKEEREAKKAKKRQEDFHQLVSEREKVIFQIGHKILAKMYEDGIASKDHHQDKLDGVAYGKIYAEKSFRNLTEQWKRFAKFVAQHWEGDDLPDLDSLRPYVNLYLQSCIDKGLTPDTLTSYRTWLAKVFGEPANAFLAVPTRNRAGKTRSRKMGQTKKNPRISDEKLEFYRMIGEATGLRRRELKQITGDALELKRSKNGFYYMHLTKKHGPKNGRERWAPIIAKNPEEEAYIVDLFRKAGKGQVFKQVHTHFDEHYFRAGYAARLYRHYERDLSKLSHKEKTYLRKEFVGVVLDKEAELKVARALGHKRIEEFRKSYIHRLLE